MKSYHEFEFTIPHEATDKMTVKVYKRLDDDVRIQIEADNKYILLNFDEIQRIICAANTFIRCVDDMNAGLPCSSES